jgi:hypothetical protein
VIAVRDAGAALQGNLSRPIHASGDITRHTLDGGSILIADSISIADTHQSSQRRSQRGIVCRSRSLHNVSLVSLAFLMRQWTVKHVCNLFIPILDTLAASALYNYSV